MSVFVGLNPSAVRAAADRLDASARQLEDAHRLARTGFSFADLPDEGILRRLGERQELLRNLAAELRERATAVDQARLDLNSHVATLTIANLASRGLDSVNTVSELDDAIARWSGSDNDPFLDALIAERSQLNADLNAWAVMQIEDIANATIGELAQRLDVSHTEARRVIENELPHPFVLTESPFLYESVNDQLADKLGGRILTVELLVALALGGEIEITTFIAGSSEQALIDPSGLDGPALASYLSMLAEREHSFRLAYDYTLDGVDYDEAQLELFRLDAGVREFETQRFGVDHSGQGVPGIHTMLDIVGMVPVIGEWADGLNAGIYTIEGDWVNAGISAAALVPVAGSTATGARLIHRGTRLADRLDGTILNTLQAADGTLIHRIRRADGAVINVVETADGKTVHTALMGTDNAGGSFIANGATVHHTPTATAVGDDFATRTNLERSRGVAGHDVVVHGDFVADGSTSFFTNGLPTHTQQIADAILENPNYNIGDPIQLITCHGACGLADELSSALGDVQITASPHRVRIDAATGLLEEKP